MFIGAPGSGKTTALLNSGLNFAVEQGGRQGRLKGIGGTRNCDWWFTDEAIFLDTAGRYHDPGLRCELRQRRLERISGAAASVPQTPADQRRHPHHQRERSDDRRAPSGREAHVEAARRRLRELNRELQIQLPVYVMVTKCDLVAGFTEYFDDLAQDGRAQVWGVTFPYEQTLSGEATQRFSREFEALITRLNERLFSTARGRP